ncbi:MAG: hypothetical protein Q8P41_09540 [Pseudomonadota bacterium]|nr:hypothetical protein [Pseudomonadota bacterium]
MHLRPALLVSFLAILACSGGPEDGDRFTPVPPPAPEPEPPAAPAPPPEEVIPEEKAPVGGWIQDEVIYDADGSVYGCVGGGNWCASSPARDPVTHAPRPAR